VPPKYRAQALALEHGLESAFGASLGTPIVAYFANANGYIAYEQKVSDLTPQQRQHNVEALGKAILTFCVPVLLLCLAVYTLIGFTHPRDLARLRARPAEEDSSREDGLLEHEASASVNNVERASPSYAEVPPVPTPLEE